jgi:hypothetical protein
MNRLISNFLNIAEPPRKVETIFVLAGKETRKAHGIELWNRGYAPELILSIGRFEWRKFYNLGLPGDGGLLRLVKSTPPEKRHFFVRLRNHQAEAYLIPILRYGTITEAQALSQLFRADPPASMMVLSTPTHLRRVAVAFRHAFRGLATKLTFVATPEDDSLTGTAAVWTEFAKYIFYRVRIYAQF